MFLLETLNVKFSGLVAQLYSDQVVGAAERDDISAEQTSFTANEKLLSVLSRKSPQQFQLFLDALDSCGQPHVRNVITAPRGLSIKTTNFAQTNGILNVLLDGKRLLLLLVGKIGRFENSLLSRPLIGCDVTN